MCRAVLAGSRDAGMGAVDIAVGDVLLFLASEGSPLVGHVELAETEDGDKYQWGFAFDATAPIAQFLLGTRQVCGVCGRCGAPLTLTWLPCAPC